MASKEGMPKVFLTFTAEDAVLIRGHQLIIGNSALREYFKNKTTDNEHVCPV